MVPPLSRHAALRPTRMVVASVVVAVVAACSPASDATSADTIDEVHAALDEAHETQAELLARIEALESQRPADSAADIASLNGRVSELEDRLAEERDARLAFAPRLEDLEQDLRSSLADIRDGIEALRGQIADLEIRYEVLQTRIDRLS